MRGATKLFYAAIFAFLGVAHAHQPGSRDDTCALDPRAMVSDACVSYGTIDTTNDQIYNLLHSITQDTDFFSYYRLNLFNKECPFWSDANSMCGNIACSVNTIESEEDIPLIWRAEELSKLEGPKAHHPPRQIQAERPKERPLQGMLGDDVRESCVVEYDDECDERDYCVPEDEGSTGKGDYVSLVDNPERFTGYSGEGAHQVWDAIYRENCFMKADELPQQSLFVPGVGGAVSDFRNVLQKESQRLDGLPLDNECREKRVFHRLISGMHASISTHLCWDYLNQTTGEWHPNMQCYKERLHDYPERISNMYFNYALVSRAVAKLRKHLQNYTFCTSDPAQDLETKARVTKLTNALADRSKIFDEKLMFQAPDSIALKEDFRNRFRNVSRLMDCVGCDKCRLWGKVQVNGYGTALKVLFDYDETKNGENPLLRRTELVALINTLGRLSHSISAARSFHVSLLAGRDQAFPLHGDAPYTHNHNHKQVKEETNEEKPRRLFRDGGSVFYYENDEEFVYADGIYEGSRLPWERPPRDPHATFLDSLGAEYTMFRDTFVYVLRSWIRLPNTLLHIGTSEGYRLWNYWLGLPVPPREWKIQVPGRRAVPVPEGERHTDL